MPNDYQYVRPQLTDSLVVLQRKSDGAFIPNDPANADYAAFLAAGSLADPAPAVVSSVVLEVNPVALRWALRQTPDPSGAAANALVAITNALAQPGLEDAQDAFLFAVTMKRADLIAMGLGFGFTPSQIDAVLSLAATRPDSGAAYGAP